MTHMKITLLGMTISVQTTCKGWKEQGLEDNTEVEIQRNPMYDSFWVHCDVDILNGTGVTMICEYNRH